MSELKHANHWLVAYTDGGCRGAQNFTGGGIHGFYYDPTEQKEPIKATIQNNTPTNLGFVDSNNKVELVKAKAIAYTPVSYFDMTLALGVGTNNTAELEAAKEAVRIATRQQVKHTLILADSKYVVDGCTDYLPRWKQANWTRKDGQPLANVDGWKEIDNLISVYNEQGGKVEFKYTPAHIGNFGNERADTNATRGVNFAKYFGDPSIVGAVGIPDSFLVEEDGSPKNKTVYSNSRFLSSPHCFFQTKVERKPTEEGYHVYRVGSLGPDVSLWGKPISDVSYSAVYLKEPEKYIEDVIQYQESIEDRSYGGYFMAYLDTVLSGKHVAETDIYGRLGWHCLGKSKSVMNTEGNMLTESMDPPRLAWYAEENWSLTQGILDQFLFERKNKEDDARKVKIPGMIYFDEEGRRVVKTTAELLVQLVVTDVTNLIYQKVTKGSKEAMEFGPLIGQSTKEIELDVKYNTTGTEATTPITLTVGLDMPRRNMLAAVAKDNPKVYVVTWRNSSAGFRFATIVETDEGIGSWCSVFSNFHVVMPDSDVARRKRVAVAPLEDVFIEEKVKAPKKSKKKKRKKGKKTEEDQSSDEEAT